MNKKLTGIIGKYLGKQLDFRVRLFNVLAVAGTAISGCMALLGVFNGAGIFNVAINVVLAALSFALLTYSKRSGNYQLCYMVVIVTIFLVLFPFMFFYSGAYRSGMPLFFVFAVVFTIFMLEGKKAVVLSVLEIVVYIVICVAAYRYPQMVHWFDSEQAVLIDVIVGFVAVSAALGVSLALHFRLYNEQQRELTARNNELDRINRQKTEFLSNISHELKTPLTVVSSYIQILQKELEPHTELKNTHNTARLVGGEVERMALMVAQILDVSRIDEGRMEVKSERESLIEIIQTTLNTYYPVFTKNHNQLVFLRTGNVPAVRCDRARVMQVLVNLIGNAARHTREGEIAVSAGLLDGQAVVTVSDTGEGIAAERIPFLFQRYHSYQAAEQEQARSGWDTGTGLGLYICKHIIEEHGGHIWIESEPGKGTEARFTLPLDT